MTISGSGGGFVTKPKIDRGLEVGVGEWGGVSKAREDGEKEREEEQEPAAMLRPHERGT